MALRFRPSSHASLPGHSTCTIDAFRCIAPLPFPKGDETVTGVRAGIRRTPLRRAPEPGPPDLRLRVSRCGRSRLPAPAGWAGTLQGRVQASVDKLGRAHAARISAILSDAALRWDCLREAWLGDV